jgi:predicted esterase
MHAADAAQSSAAGSDVPWLGEVQRRPETLPADAPRLPPLLVDESGARIATLAAWQKKREATRRWWLDFLRPLDVSRETPPSLEVVGEARTGGVVRQLVRYTVEPGLLTEAYLLKPAVAAGRRPGVAVFHQTTSCSIRESAGVEGRSELAFGLELARRGFVALCPRNFLWPDNRTIAIPQEMKRFQARHPKSLGMAKMLFDALRAVDLLAAMAEVDPQRIGAVGHSLGAKEVLYLAAFDERVRATVSSDGGIGIRFSNWHDPWYLGEAVKAPGFGHEHHELLALAAPRPFLLLAGESVDGAKSWPFIEAALPVYALYGQPARVGLLNHKKGHTVPPEAAPRLYEWFEKYLRL